MEERFACVDVLLQAIEGKWSKLFPNVGIVKFLPSMVTTRCGMRDLLDTPANCTRVYIFDFFGCICISLVRHI